MNHFKYSLLFSLLIVSAFISLTSATTPPTPAGYSTGGLYQKYFQNMILGYGGTGICPTGQGLIGFDTGSTDSAFYGIPKCSTVASYWTATGSTIYYKLGKVAIGTDTGAADLTVSGTIAANTYYFNPTGSSTLSGGYDTNFTWTWWGNHISNLNSGNVGIGILSPAYKLDVNGDFNVGSGTTGDFTVTTSKYLSYKPGGTSCLANQILSWSGTLSPDAGWVCASDSAGITGLSLTTNYLTKWNGAYLANSQIFDTGTGVGIGTTSPAYKLDIAGTLNATAFRGDGSQITGVPWTGITGKPTVVSAFTNDAGYLTPGFASTSGQPASTALANETGYGAFQAQAQGNAATAGAAFMSFHRPNAYAAYLGIDTDNVWKVGGWSMGANSYPLILGNSYPNGAITASAFNYSSDRRLKDHIVSLTGSLDRLMKLSGYSFDWKSDGRKDIGVIAQEVEKQFPDIVHTDTTSGMKSVEYANLVAPLIESVKELKKITDTQDEQIKALRQEIQALK